MKTIKKISLLFILLIALYTCQDNLLNDNIEPIDNNLPALSSLSTIDGLTIFSTGIYDFLASDDVFESVGTEKESPLLWFSYGYHETMGDILTMPWGNFGGRWVNQTESVVLDDGTVVNPPAGGPQPGEIAIRNTRDAGSDNATQYEWRDMYSIIIQSNTIFEAAAVLDASEADQQAFSAWALWWKAYAYSRIGSLYEQGLIYDEGLITHPTGIPVSESFVSNINIINESNAVLDQLEILLSSVTDDGGFNTRFEECHVGIIDRAFRVNKAGLEENINSLRIRNKVYNTKLNDMTIADWTEVITLANNGVSNTTNNIFIMVSESTFIDNGWLPGQFEGFWYFPSDRLIQDINPDDNRLDLYFSPNFNFPNPRGRGIQYGATRFWNSETPITSQTPGAVQMYYASSYEENQLFLAEAKIRTGDIEGGLGHLDTVRAFQNSGLPATVGTNLSEEDALEEVRKERRLALFMRAVSFYDARRYGIASGSRTGAWVLDTNGNLNTNATINYGYLEYWPIPAFESDFNSVLSPTPQ